MQAVVTACLIMQHQWSGTRLAGFVANFEEGLVRWRERFAAVAQCLGPGVCDMREMRIRVGTQFGDRFRKRTCKIFVVAGTEAMPLHNDVAAETFFLGIQSDNRFAFPGGE